MKQSPTLVIARQIYSLLRHSLGCEGPKVEEVALSLAEYLDKKPVEMFDLTYDELFQAAIDYRLRRPTEPIALYVNKSEGHR